MKKSVTLILILVSAAISLHVTDAEHDVDVEHEANTFPTGRVNLKADTGKYLARCNGCGPSKYNDSAAA